jgi:PAS domain S-box-containing protein
MKINLNKLFPFLSIRKKMIIAFSLLSFVPLIIIGMVGIYINVNSMYKTAMVNLEHNVIMFKEKARNFLLNVHLDIQLMSDSPIFRQYLKDFDDNRVQGTSELLTEQLLTFAKKKKIYYQLRFCDRYGDERFLIQQRNSDFIISEDPVSQRSYVHYFILTESLQKGQIYFAPNELKDDNFRLIPVISFANRIYDQKGDFAGIFVADVFSKDFFNVLEEISYQGPVGKIAIISQDGFYIYYSEKKKNWNRLLANRDGENLFRDYPDHYEKAILSGDSGVISAGHNEIIAYSPLFKAQLPWSNSYYIFQSIAKNLIFSQVTNFAVILIGLLLLFIIISISLGFLATIQFANPIRELKKGAEIISQGNYSHRLKIETNDEIEQLADQFNQMANALNEREKLLEEHQKQLEGTVATRTKDLKDEKEKLQAIIDNVPSAFILLDRNFKIKTASSALAALSNYKIEDALVQPCYTVFGEKEFCHNCPSKSASKTGKMASIVKEKKLSNGETRYLEHMSIPIRQNGSITSILEIVTDITERKLMEKQTIRAEKLSAMGEMAAVIAHENRNSLTSLKLILQFLNESNEIQSTAKNSIEIALSSVSEMEGVITQLLNFARPKPSKIVMLDINQIIRESIAFIQHQIDRLSVQLVEEFEDNLPPILHDQDHMKAAFVNILINAIQATPENGHLKVITESCNLPDSLSDFSGDHRTTVKLFKGQRVIQVRFEDNGFGIDEENLDRIFEPFFTTKVAGTGLGLPMAKRVINEQGGLILVESQVGKGSVFKVILQCQDQK